MDTGVGSPDPPPCLAVALPARPTALDRAVQGAVPGRAADAGGRQPPRGAAPRRRGSRKCPTRALVRNQIRWMARSAPSQSRKSEGRRSLSRRAGPRKDGAGDGNRTHASSLGSCSSTIELHPRRAIMQSRNERRNARRPSARTRREIAAVSGWPRSAGLVAGRQVFADARRLALALTQIVELGPCDLASPLNGHRLDSR